jgi:integrase
VFPTIGALPISELNAPLVLAVLREIESRGAIETAKRVRQRISSVFVFAIAKGITQSDPAERLGAVLKPLRKGRQPAITDLVRLRAMIMAAKEDYARPITRLGLRLLALTAVRPSELRGARWDEFEDLNGEAPSWHSQRPDEGRSLPEGRNRRRPFGTAYAASRFSSQGAMADDRNGDSGLSE